MRSTRGAASQSCETVFGDVCKELRVRISLVCIFLLASSSSGVAQVKGTGILVGVEAGALYYESGATDKAPLASGFLELRLGDALFTRASYSKAWPRMHVVCLDNPGTCGTDDVDRADNVRFTRILLGAGVPIGRVLVFVNGGPERMCGEETNKCSTDLIAGGGISVDVTAGLGITGGYLRHNGEDVRANPSSYWEVSGGLTWRLR
jgi:hypothetical protein